MLYDHLNDKIKIMRKNTNNKLKLGKNTSFKTL
jgi:hypothetical protein